jgi:biotin carboxylase
MAPVESAPRPEHRRLLVLGGGPAQIGLLRSASERGLYVVAADRDPRAPGFRHADRRAVISIEDELGLDRLAAAERIDGIVAPGSDIAVAAAARIANRLGLPHPLDPRTAQLAVSTLRRREAFSAAGVPQPRYRVCATLAEARTAARELGSPCVVKPPGRRGQKGLAIIEEGSAVAAAFDEARRAARGGVVLVEEHVAGVEVTVNAFSVGGRLHGLTATERVLADPPDPGITLAHVWPSSLAPPEAEQAVAAVAAAAAALGVADGPTSTQVLFGPDGPRVGELAARLGGDHDAELCEAAVGIDLNGLVLAAALGEPVAQTVLRPADPVGGACVRWLAAPPGALASVEGLDAARQRDGVVWVRVYLDPGSGGEAPGQQRGRAGAVLAVGRSPAQAAERAGRAAERIRFVASAAEALA